MQGSIEGGDGKLRGPIQLNLIDWHGASTTIWSAARHWSPSWSVTLVPNQGGHYTVFINFSNIGPISDENYSISTNSYTFKNKNFELDPIEKWSSKYYFPGIQSMHVYPTFWIRKSSIFRLPSITTIIRFSWQTPLSVPNERLPIRFHDTYVI